MSLFSGGTQTRNVHSDLVYSETFVKGAFQIRIRIPTLVFLYHWNENIFKYYKKIFTVANMAIIDEYSS